MEVCAESYAGPSVLQKAQRNRAVLVRTRFKTLWRSEIHINRKIDTDAGVGFFSGVQYIISVKKSEGNMLESAHASTTYGMWRKNPKLMQLLPTVLLVY
jgi:hypothetical protein